jgi:hypothetical protein
MSRSYKTAHTHAHAAKSYRRMHAGDLTKYVADFMTA